MLDIAMAVLVAQGSAHAIELGTLKYRPSAGAGAQAEVAVQGVAEPEHLFGWVGSPDAYRAAGLNPADAPTGIFVEPQRAGPNTALLRLERLPSAGRPYDLLLFVTDKDGVVIGKYRIDPQAGARELPVSTIGIPQFARAAARREPAFGELLNAPAKAGAVAGPVPVDRAGQVRSALEDWARAWSRRDVDAYLAAYAPDYAGRTAGRTREDWVKERTQRILARKKISVELSQMQFVERADAVVVTLAQTYRADDSTIRSRKRIMLVPGQGGRWLIRSEDEGT